MQPAADIARERTGTPCAPISGACGNSNGGLAAGGIDLGYQVGARLGIRRHANIRRTCDLLGVPSLQPSPLRPSAGRVGRISNRVAALIVRPSFTRADRFQTRYQVSSTKPRCTGKPYSFSNGTV
jgi:hypothetical protein